MKVCIDPGHGMSNRKAGVFDPGCVHDENGTLFREADIVLKYGLALKEKLRAKNIDVFMTRDDNSDPTPVSGRAASAKAAGCDRFVSIHVNAAEDETAHGLEVLYDDAADKPLAQKMQTALIAATKLRNRGIKQRSDLAVLKFKGPAVLIELGFIDNDKDRDTFLDPLVRDKVCDAIAASL
jgi:N-acetylmuramoyl-L-alanine amidase